MMGIRFSLIKEKSKKMIIGDFRAGWHDSNIFESARDRKINVLFADGHIEYVTEKEWQDNIKKPLY